MTTLLKNIKHLVILCLITLFCWQWFEYSGFSNGFLKIGLFCSVFALTIYSLPIIRSGKCCKLRYFTIMKAILCISWLSIFMGFLFRGQSLLLGFRASAPHLLLYIFFFALIRLRPTIKTLETWIILFAFIYIILWSYAFVHIPNQIFGQLDEDQLLNDSRGIFRLYFVGFDTLLLAIFYCLNKYNMYSSKKYLLLVSIFFVFLVLQLTRQIIVIAVLIGAVYYFRNRKKLCLGISIIVFLLYSSTDFLKFSDDSILGNLIELTEHQAESNSQEENIRITEYKYFFTEWHHGNPITTIFGTGQPHSDSPLGKYADKLKENEALYLSDVGYAMMFATIGICGLCLFLLLFYKGCSQQVSDRFMYAKMYFYAIVLCNIASGASCSPNCIFLTCICLYVMEVERQISKNGHPMCEKDVLKSRLIIKKCFIKY